MEIMEGILFPTFILKLFFPYDQNKTIKKTISTNSPSNLNLTQGGGSSNSTHPKTGIIAK